MGCHRGLSDLDLRPMWAPARDRQPARRKRQNRPVGDNQHRAPLASQRRPTYSRQKARRLGPIKSEVLIIS